jgi:hypothetical protein
LWKPRGVIQEREAPNLDSPHRPVALWPDGHLLTSHGHWIRTCLLLCHGPQLFLGSHFFSSLWPRLGSHALTLHTTQSARTHRHTQAHLHTLSSSWAKSQPEKEHIPLAAPSKGFFWKDWNRAASQRTLPLDREQGVQVWTCVLWVLSAPCTTELSFLLTQPEVVPSLAFLRL